MEIYFGHLQMLRFINSRMMAMRHLFSKANLEMNLSLVNAYENVSILNDSLSLVCLDNGFMIYNKEHVVKKDLQNKLPLPYLRML